MTKRKHLNIKGMINRNGMFFFIITIAFIFLTIGMTFNFMAIKENHGMMPVKGNYTIYDNEHFSFQNNSEVNHWYFTDIINVPLNGQWSIGDILMVIGCFIILNLTISCWMDSYFIWRKKHAK